MAKKTTKISRNINKIDSNAEYKKNDKILNKHSDDNEFSKLIKIIFIICVCFTAFYILTVIIQKIENNNSKNQKLSTETNKIQYDEILMSKILKQSKEEYYVLIKEENDDNDYTSIINSLSNNKVYTSKLNSAFNRKYVGETSNLIVSNIDELKVKETTLLHIKEHKVIDAKEGKTAVFEHLQTLD